MTDEEWHNEISTLRERVERTEAVLAVQRLKAEYGELVDRRFSLGKVVDPDVLNGIVAMIVDLFVEDAVWDGGPVLGIATGRDQIAERLRKPTLTFSRHLFVKPRITVQCPVATARWDLLCPCKTPDGRSWWMCGFEDDEYRLEQGVWRHSKMKLTSVFMSRAGEGFDRILF
ncbi:MAG: nuclear transport factor 2 family protein [Acidimicrobiales bacterium]|jgi:SnoaL-like domain